MLGAGVRAPDGGPAVLTWRQAGRGGHARGDAVGVGGVLGPGGAGARARQRAGRAHGFAVPAPALGRRSGPLAGACVSLTGFSNPPDVAGLVLVTDTIDRLAKRSPSAGGRGGLGQIFGRGRNLPYPGIRGSKRRRNF